MNPVVEDVTNITRRTLGGCLLALVRRRSRLRVGIKMAVVQLANADSDFAFEPNSNVSNLCVSCWNGDNEPVSELRLKTVAWHNSLKLGQKSLREAIEFWF